MYCVWSIMSTILLMLKQYYQVELLKIVKIIIPKRFTLNSSLVLFSLREDRTVHIYNSNKRV